MLINYFTRKRILIETLQTTQILGSKELIKTMQVIKTSARDLRKHMSEITFWLLKDKSDARATKEEVTRIFESLTKYCVLHDVTDSMEVDTEENDPSQTQTVNKSIISASKTRALTEQD